MYYGPILLGKAGFGGNMMNETLIDALPLAFVNSAGTLVAVFYIDKLGRRFIMLRSIPGIAISLIIVSLGLGLHSWGSTINA